MLEIRDVRLNDDGTSEVDTLGGKVFRVISRGNRDGYDTARVEFLQDEAVEEDELEGVDADTLYVVKLFSLEMSQRSKCI